MKGVTLLLYFISIVIMIVLSFFTITYILRISGEVNAYIVRADATRKAELLFHIYTHDRRFSTRDGVLDFTSNGWFQKNEAGKRLEELIADRDIMYAFFPLTEDAYDYKLAFSATDIGFCEYDHAMRVEVDGKYYHYGYVEVIDFDKEQDPNTREFSVKNIETKFPDWEEVQKRKLTFYTLADFGGGDVKPAKIEIVVFDKLKQSRLLCLFAKAYNKPGTETSAEMVVSGSEFHAEGIKFLRHDGKIYYLAITGVGEKSATLYKVKLLKDVTYLGFTKAYVCKIEVNKVFRKNDLIRRLRIEWEKNDFYGNWCKTCKDLVKCR